MKETLAPHADGVIRSIVGLVTSSMVKVSLQRQTNSFQTQTNPPIVEVLTTRKTKPN